MRAHAGPTAGNASDDVDMVKIIGIDPGLAATGVGIVRGLKHKVHSYSYTSINTSKKLTLPHRLNHIFLAVQDILSSEQPDCMIVEDIFSLPSYPISGITLGKVSGIILLAGCQKNIPVMEIPVREAKKVLTGNGSASKAQLEMAVRRILNRKEPIRPDHASDAMGLSLIGFYRYGSQLEKR